MIKMSPQAYFVPYGPVPICVDSQRGGLLLFLYKINAVVLLCKYNCGYVMFLFMKKH